MILQVEEINEIEALTRRRELWEDLLRRSPGASFFQTLDWLVAYWRHYGADQRLRALFVSANDEVLGVLPLVVRRERTKVGLLRTLTYPLDDWGSFYGPIGANCASILEAGLKHVKQTRRDWDVLDLRWIDSTGVDGGRTPEAMRRAGFQAYCACAAKRPWSISPAIGPAISTNAAVNGETISNAGGAIWTSAGRSPLRGIVPAPATTRPWSFTTPARPWREKVGRRTLPTARRCATKACVRSCAKSTPSPRTGRLDVSLLRIDEAPVAFAYNYVYEGYVFGLRVGYDASLSRDGAGNLLYALAIEDSFARGDRVYDLGPGSLDCKRHLKTRIVPVHRYSHYPLTAPRTQLLRLKRLVESTGITPSGETV